jgi:hypothetical protein
MHTKKGAEVDSRRILLYLKCTPKKEQRLIAEEYFFCKYNSGKGQTSIKIARSTTMLVTYPRTRPMTLLATEDDPISTSICIIGISAVIFTFRTSTKSFEACIPTN